MQYLTLGLRHSVFNGPQKIVVWNRKSLNEMLYCKQLTKSMSNMF